MVTTKQAEGPAAEDILEAYMDLDEAREAAEWFAARDIAGCTSYGYEYIPAALAEAIRRGRCKSTDHLLTCRRVSGF